MARYCFTGDRKLLRQLGYAIYRKDGLSYSRPNDYSEEAIYMVAKNQMMLQFGRIRVLHTFKVVDFIISNKDKNEDFWLFENTKLNNFILTEEGDILERANLIDIFLDKYSSKLPKELIDNLIEDGAYMKGVQIEFSEVLRSNILELDDIAPLSIL